MKLVFDEAQKRHDPKFFLSSGASKPNPEVPRRADILLAAGLDAGLELEVPRDYGLDPAASVHSPEYLDFLQNIFARWSRIEGASAEVVPNVHPDRRDGDYPASAVGQAGYHVADTSAPINAETFGSALRSAHSAAHAAELILSGHPAAYALCRPPGHHAFRDLAGGFCFLNNSAIAAQRLRRDHDRVAIIDVDLHHGNGTQGIFYARDDVLTVSLHADPVRFYPFFWGHASERGKDAGLGFNLNLPLPRHTADDGFLSALDRGLERVAAFAPGAIVIALGLDASEHDPFGGLAVTTAGFQRIGEHLARLERPAVIVQEGGYISEVLGQNLTSFLNGFTSVHRVVKNSRD
ncbi:acetoin utilization deacetylase AcuC-like enzyme [Rhodoligotrophos appendicifer]|uniref:histone deacetylase family protein n=1 Tax=Rhodoligotrophos appendicifer TaxID=987056 RepID=UPI00118637D6|nr:histone deacetylase family protein [Rhodoligotrophos appendicifer]